MREALWRDPEDLDSWRVYGDVLSEAGDPRGELIAIDCELRAGTTEERQSSLGARRRWLLAHRAQEWLGTELRAHLESLKSESAVAWHFGFLDELRLAETYDGTGPDLATLLEELRQQDISRFLRSLHLGHVDARLERQDWSHAVAALAMWGERPSLRELHIGVPPDREQRFGNRLGDLGELWLNFPNLRKLTLRGGDCELGAVVHSEIEELRLELPSLKPKLALSIGSARLPKLQSLHLSFGFPQDGFGSSFGDDFLVEETYRHFLAIFEHDTFPNLKELALRRTRYQDDFAAILAESTLLPQLRTLHIGGSLGERGAKAILDAAEKFDHLQELGVGGSTLPLGTISELRARFGDALNTRS